MRGQSGDTEAFWEGELEGLSTTGAWIYFGGHLLETYSSTQQIVALSTTESEYISIKDVAHALEIRSALAECGMTLKMMGKTDRPSSIGSAFEHVMLTFRIFEQQCSMEFDSVSKFHRFPTWRV